VPSQRDKGGGYFSPRRGEYGEAGREALGWSRLRAASFELRSHCLCFASGPFDPIDLGSFLTSTTSPVRGSKTRGVVRW